MNVWNFISMLHSGVELRAFVNASIYTQLFPPVQYVTCNEVKQVQLRGAVYLMNEYYL